MYLATHTQLDTKFSFLRENEKKGYADFFSVNTYSYKYQGQERQDELNLNWDSFKWRNYDYAIGRFMSIDPLTEEYHWFSPYAFSENRVIDSRELEGLERSWYANSLHKDFLKVYDVQRQTTGGIEFILALKTQDKYNVLYAPTGLRDISEGRTIEINSFKEWKNQVKKFGLELNESAYEKVSEGGEKDIIIITGNSYEIKDTLLPSGELYKSAEDNLFDQAVTLNHEEVAHAKSKLEGNTTNQAKEHLDYNGEHNTFSPKNEDILNLDKYKGTTARQNFEEISEIIKNEKK